MSDLTSALRRLLRLLGLDDLPAVPVDLRELLETLPRLAVRDARTQPARRGLSTEYTIGGHTAEGRAFLFGEAPSTARADAFWKLHGLLGGEASKLEEMLAALLRGTAEAPDAGDAGALTKLPLDSPEQWTISWTTDPDIYSTSHDRVSGWAATLTDTDAANTRFWPLIATHGMAYNLLMLEKVGGQRLAALTADFEGSWNIEWNALSAEGRLYAIDLSVLSTVKSAQRDGVDRFAPATITLLSQDPDTKELAPVAVRVWGEDQAPVCFVPSDNAWLYALQAAKTSVTVYGIWLGHVYHWHMVSAAMQMTMFANLPSDHRVSLLLGPQSKYLIGFDNVLLVAWRQIAPPTAPADPLPFLELINAFAKDRGFFDDDPVATLQRGGISEEDFHNETAWDRYPIAGQLLRIWHDTEQYVGVFVDESYVDDLDVANDEPLQAWLAAAADEKGGNIRGLGTIDSKSALTRLLTSLVYRLTVHGVSRLSAIANPALTFVANFPPCLQKKHIPDPAAKIDLGTLLSYLPRTGTIGEMVNFYFTFAFSSPYEPLIPSFGVTANLFFPGGLGDPRNQALVKYRRAIASFIEDLDPDAVPQYRQWPMSIET